MTLTELSYYTRKYYPFAILAVLIFLIVYYSIQLTLIILESKRKNIYINPVFGQIKAPDITDASPSGQIKYTLENVEGRPVTATESANVYFLPPTATKFGYRERLLLAAKQFGFSPSTRYTIEGNQAVFQDDAEKLTVDITNFNFSYEYFFEGNEEIFKRAVPPTTQESQTKAIGFLQSVGRYPEELSRGEVKIKYLNYDAVEKSFIPVERNVKANAAEIDFFRPETEKLLSVSSRFPESHNHVVMVFYEDDTYKILRAKMRFYERSLEQYGVYPLRSGDEAYSDLKQGRAFVVSNPKGVASVTIRRMYVAYYDPEEYQDYLQPIYVFLGDENFAAFVPAVSREYLIK